MYDPSRLPHTQSDMLIHTSRILSCMMTITTVTVEISSLSIETKSPQNTPHPRQELALCHPYTPYPEL